MASAAAAKADWQTSSSNRAEVSAAQVSESERALQQLAANFLSQSTARPLEADLASSGETIPLSEAALSAASLLAAASSSAPPAIPCLILKRGTAFLWNKSRRWSSWPIWTAELAR